MAKKEKKETKKAKVALTPEQEAKAAAKKAARKEALKNRPAGQRPNSKQIDVITVSDTCEIRNFGYPIKKGTQHVGVLVTSVAVNNGEVTSTSVTLVPGDFTVKSKKGHGTISPAKHKGDNGAASEDEVED